MASAKVRGVAKMLGFYSWGFPGHVSSIAVSGLKKVGVGSRKRGGRGRAFCLRNRAGRSLLRGSQVPKACFGIANGSVGWDV